MGLTRRTHFLPAALRPYLHRTIEGGAASVLVRVRPCADCLRVTLPRVH
ncbi:hypothetical protein ACFFX0_21785 [Citricoccus parietis]|uniref:Uncharacterized protein n=1 Tax=Citricoccus parietis TaxID=592307 RepID=A0ABV5G454_9MICC